MTEQKNKVEHLAREDLRIVAAADYDAVDGHVTPDYFNHRSDDEPMEARQPGPEGLKATMRWLHRAFAELRFEFHEVITDGDRVAARVTMHGRQHGPFVVHDSPDGEVTDVFPSTGRAFSVEQTHWYRIANGAVAEHDAVRDDLGMAKQLGRYAWRPWTFEWEAREPGECELCVRATDAAGRTQPADRAKAWNHGGFGVNLVQRVGVVVRPAESVRSQDPRQERDVGGPNS